MQSDTKSPRTVTHFSLSCLWLMTLLTFSWGCFHIRWTVQELHPILYVVHQLYGAGRWLDKFTLPERNFALVIIFNILFSQWLSEVYNPQSSADTLFPADALPALYCSGLQSCLFQGLFALNLVFSKSNIQWVWFLSTQRLVHSKTLYSLTIKISLVAFSLLSLKSLNCCIV